MIYLIGSLRNKAVPVIANRLREEGFEVFDDWYAAGPKADDEWQKYEKARGHNFQQALKGHAANHVYSYDRHHLERADFGLLVLPSGKSGHLELGWLMGRGKPGYILLNGEPKRFDVMYLFASGVFNDLQEFIDYMKDVRMRYRVAPSKPRSNRPEDRELFNT